MAKGTKGDCEGEHVLAPIRHSIDVYSVEFGLRGVRGKDITDDKPEGILRDSPEVWPTAEMGPLRPSGMESQLPQQVGN